MTHWQLLLVDVDNTLFNFDACQALALEHTCNTLGIAYHSDMLEAYEQINAALWAAYERKEITQAALRHLRSERFLAYAKSDLAPDEFGERYVHALGSYAVPIPGALEVIREAAALLPIVAITNGIAEVQRRRMAASPIAPYIKAMAISGELGIAKPDPRIVQAAMTMGGADDPARVLLLGDSLSADIAGAQAADVQSCWYNPGHVPCSHTPPPTYEIHELSALLQLL